MADKSKGISERELDPSLLARIGMGNYLQKQTLSVTTTEDNQKIISIPLDDYKSQIYKFDVVIDGLTYPDYKYTIDEKTKTIILKDDVIGIVKDKKVDFIFQWNSYINKTIQSPTVYLDDCNTKVCTIKHNMKKFPHIQVLEVTYGAGIGITESSPAGSASKMLYPRIDYIDDNVCDLYLDDDYDAYKNPVLNRVSEGKYTLTFDAPCIKSLMILIDKFELFNNEDRLYIDEVVTPITNPVKGFVKDQIIYGNTLQNIWNVNNIKAVWDNTKALIEDKTQSMYKATKNTIINLSNKPITVSIYDTVTLAYGNIIEISPNAHNVITLTANKIIGSISGEKNDGWTSINYIELDTSVIILEGDYTGKHIPTSYFSGMESIGDKPVIVKAINNTDTLSSDYQESLSMYGVPLRGIGAVKDEYDVDKCLVIRKIANVNLGYDFIDSILCDTNNRTKTYRVILSELCDLGTTSFPINSICNKANYNNNFDKTDIESEYYIGYNATTKSIDLCININKLKLTDTSNTSIIKYLRSTNINIMYELPKYIKERVSNLPIKLDDSTKYIVIDTNIMSEMEFEYPLNIKSTIDNMVDMLNSLRDDVTRANKQASDKMGFYIGKTLPEIKDPNTLYLKITNEIHYENTDNIKVSPLMGLKII